MPVKFYNGEQFFKSWKKVPYRFRDDADQRYFNGGVKSSGAVVLWDLYHDIKRATGFRVPHLEMLTRSKFTPEMLYPHATKWDNGGKMGDYDAAILKQAYGIVRKMFKLKKNIQPIEVSQVNYDKTKNSGLPWCTQKGEVYPEALKEVSAIRRGKCPEPYLCFWRGKNLEEARIVLAETFPIMLIAGTFFEPFQEMLLKTTTPFAGGRRNLSVATMVNEIRSNSRFVGEFDYSGFDSSISAKLISMAFSIIKENFDMTKSQEKDWDIVVKHFMYGPIVMQDGNMYVGRRHGVPSGSLFTQIVDSIVNALVISYAGLRLDWSITRIVVLGDDSVVGFRTPVQRIDDIALVMAELGIKLNAKKSKVHVSGQDVHFLGHCWTYGVPSRDVEETIIRIVCPERIKPWMRYDKRGTKEYYDGVFERLRAFQNDNMLAWGDIQRVLDYYRHPDLPQYWGMFMHVEDMFNISVVESGLQRGRRATLPKKGSPRITAMY